MIDSIGSSSSILQAVANSANIKHSETVREPVDNKAKPLDYQTWDILDTINYVKTVMENFGVTQFTDYNGYMIDYSDRTFTVKLEDRYRPFVEKGQFINLII